MRSRLETKVLSADDVLAGPHQHSTSVDYDRLARVYRAAAIGEVIADVIIWGARLPGRIAAALSRRMVPSAHQFAQRAKP